MTHERGHPPEEWDAAAHERAANPRFDWSQEVLDRVRLRGDETVIDVGWVDPPNCAEASATEQRLREAGFMHVRAEITPDQVIMPDAEHYQKFLRAVALRLIPGTCMSGCMSCLWS